MFDLLEYIVRKAESEGATQAEAFYSHTVDTRIIVRKKEVKIGEVKDDAGIGIRVAVKKTGGALLGFSYTTQLNREVADKVIRQALDVAQTKKPDPDFKSFQESIPKINVENIYDKQVEEIDANELIELALDQIRIASKDKRIDVFDSFIFPRTQEIVVANSLGVEEAFKRTNFYVLAEAVAKEGSSTAFGFDEYSNCYYTKEEPLKIAENAVSLALDQLHSKPIQKGKTSLIISPSGLAELLAYTLCTEVGANLVQTNRSPFVNKLGQQVASEALTIHDNGRVPKACGSRAFDDEGCPAQKTTIIEKGILKNLLHDTYTANKESVKSTGNSLRYTLLRTTSKYLLEPSVGPSNIIVEPGTSSSDSLISEVKSGIITKDFLGCHTASAESGDFSISLHCAFKIENGEIKYPIKEAMIGGNILKLLKNISIIANNTEQVQFMNAALVRDATLISPSILVENVPVAG